MFFVRYISYFNKDEFLRKLVLLTIFLSIFALIFSLIALYYGQLNKEKYKAIDSVKEHQIMIQEYSSKILKYKANLINEEKNAFNYFLIATLNATELQYAEKKYCNALKLSLSLSVFTMKSIIDKGKDFLTKDWKTEHLIEKYNFTYMSKNVDDLFNKFSKDFMLTCNKNELNNILSSYSQQKHFYDRLLYLVKELKFTSSKRLKDTFKDLDENNIKTRNLIIIAFLIQLIIFIVLNFIDIRRIFNLGLKR